MDSVFMTRTELEKKDNDISGKITFTNVLDTIPPESVEIPLEEWSNKTEWRWRFMKFANERTTVEISYKPNEMKEEQARIYFNRKGEWVKRKVPDIYNEYVVKEYYYYS